jgi:hypothetical protein
VTAGDVSEPTDNDCVEAGRMLVVPEPGDAPGGAGVVIHWETILTACCPFASVIGVRVIVQVCSSGPDGLYLKSLKMEHLLRRTKDTNEEMIWEVLRVVGPESTAFWRRKMVSVRVRPVERAVDDSIKKRRKRDRRRRRRNAG